MAQAGYDPAEAPPEFMSTHPSDERRATALTEKLPEAEGHFANAVAPVGIGEVI